MSRLSIEVTPEFHHAIKEMAFEQGVSLRDFVLEKHSKATKKSSKIPNARLLASIAEGFENEKAIKEGTLKPYKTTKEIFDRYQ